MFSNTRLRDKDFYYQDLHQLNTGDAFTLNDENTHHNAVVLRRKLNENIVIIDGKGTAYLCQITDIAKRHCQVKIIDKSMQSIRPHQLHLAIGLTRNKSRNEWFFEKAVEIGTDAVWTLDCDHSELDDINPTRVQAIISSAMIQSKAYYLPDLHLQVRPTSVIKLFKEKHPDGLVYIAHCEDQIKNHALTTIKSDKHTLILIGPEGDFSSEEIADCLKLGATPISLGEKRLRTETAAIYSITLFNAINYA